MTDAPTQTAAFGHDVPRVSLALAEADDRPTIYRLRHATYAHELGQHAPNPDELLTDALDAINHYIVARRGELIVGFVSITPPGHGALSIDKYVERNALPFVVDRTVFEVRLLTVVEDHRGSDVAAHLMHAALRYIENEGGTRVVVMGRRALRGLYARTGLRPVGLDVVSGAVHYEILTATIPEVRATVDRYAALHERVGGAEWLLPFDRTSPDLATPEPVGCFHGGAFFEAIGEDFRTLERAADVINADVLDAWYPPAPGVLESLSTHLAWLARTSPPTDAAGLVRAIAAARDVPATSIVTGAGSSALIFLAFGRWLTTASRVLVLDPTYGEYAHVLERVIGAHVDRIVLDPAADFVVDPDELRELLARNYDLVVLVNPNSPTGQHVSRADLERVLTGLPDHTRVWIDETYGAYAGDDESLASYAAASGNVVVCTSMSKVYALSGLRVAYLVGPADVIAELRSWTPPWAVSLPAQVAAVRALQDPDYYRSRIEQTRALRGDLARELVALGFEVVEGIANFVLCAPPPGAPPIDVIAARCREDDVYVRDATTMGDSLGRFTLRIAVKDAGTNGRVIDVLKRAMQGGQAAGDQFARFLGR